MTEKNKKGKEKQFQPTVWPRNNRTPYFATIIINATKNCQKEKIGMNFSYLYAWEIQPGINRCSIHRKVGSTRKGLG
jgi:hypothetical protein